MALKKPRAFWALFEQFAGAKDSGAGAVTMCKSALLAAMLLGAVCVRAQQQPSGNSSSSSSDFSLSGAVSYTDASSEACDEANPPSGPYVGISPLTCAPQGSTTDGQGNCSMPHMQTLIKKQGNLCYYCNTIDPPMKDGVIIPVDQGRAANLEGFTCGYDPFDQCKLVCSRQTGSGPYVPVPTTLSGGVSYTEPPAQPTSTGGGPSTSVPSSSVPSSGTPCEPNYDMSTAAGRAAAQAAAPQTQAACQAYQCQHNPQLPYCPILDAHVPPTPTPHVEPAPDPWATNMLANSQEILQAAGKISKEMTDAMDVTKHSNVGVSVMIGAYFGAAGKMMTLAAQTYKALAAASSVVAAAQKTPILQIAEVAATESGTLAGEATETATQLEAAGGSAGGSWGSPWGPGSGYLEDAVLEASTNGLPAQNVALPTCTVIGCARLAQILQGSGKILQAIDKMMMENLKWNTTTAANGTVTGTMAGMTPQEVQGALQGIGINAQVGTGFTNMLDQVRAGNPVIAGVFTTAAAGTARLHAVVIEGLETQGNVLGIRAYDPVGWDYWQPVETFQKYFTNDFVRPL